MSSRASLRNLIGDLPEELPEHLLEGGPGRISALLAPYITPERRERIEQILAQRTRYVSVVLDDLYHRHNMSAVVRSMDAFGFQDLHVIEMEHRFKVSKGVALGSEQWISLFRHRSFVQCVEQLRSEGRLILAADPPWAASRYGTEIPCYELSRIPVSLDRPLALVFGRERDGLHDELRRLCDGIFYIPLKGFVESLNVSVTVAITLNALRTRLDAFAGRDLQLPPETSAALRDLWYLRSVRRGTEVLKELLSRKMSPASSST